MSEEVLEARIEVLEEEIECLQEQKQKVIALIKDGRFVEALRVLQDGN